MWQVRIYSGPGLVMEQAMYKGTLTAVDDPDLLPPNTILLRRNSMRKVRPPHCAPAKWGVPGHERCIITIYCPAGRAKLWPLNHKNAP